MLPLPPFPADTVLLTLSVSYNYTPVEGGIPASFNVTSNEVPVLIAGTLADVSVIKTAAPNAVRPGDPLTYTITVSNAGKLLRPLLKKAGVHGQWKTLSKS